MMGQGPGVAGGEAMSVSRQRMTDAFEFKHPDKIPVIYKLSPAGLHVHGQKLVDLYREYPSDNPLEFGVLPAPPPGAINADGKYHEIFTDEWGTEWECLIYGVTGHPRNYPFKNWVEARDYQFPPLPVADLQKVREQRERYLIFWGWISLAEKLCALRPMDEVWMDVLSEDEDLLAFLDRMVDYWLKAIQLALEAGVDVIVFGDDWGTQHSTLISPELFRKIFKPRYERLMDPIKKAGRRVFFHSCGHLGGIFDQMLELGIDGLWPQIGLHESSPETLAKCRKHRVAIFIHPDRQHLIPLGTPAQIDAEIRRYAEHYKKNGGGAIFHVEMENDAPFENVKALVQAIHKYR
jgi:hypothetical protein